ncbi:hypothetical protein GH733_014762, partial [Mirounga leonina]
MTMSAKFDAVATRVQTAVVTMGKVTNSMAGIVKSVGATMKSMNLEKFLPMDKFEHQFETLDVQTQQMEDTMSSSTTLTMPQ